MMGGGMRGLFVVACLMRGVGREHVSTRPSGKA
jgi:hypothetical protein